MPMNWVFSSIMIVVLMVMGVIIFSSFKKNVLRVDKELMGENTVMWFW